MCRKEPWEDSETYQRDVCCRQRARRYFLGSLAISRVRSRFPLYLILLRDVVLWSKFLYSDTFLCVFFLFHLTTFWKSFDYHKILVWPSPFFPTNAKYQLDIKLSAYQKDIMAYGYCCLVLGVLLYWLPLGLKSLLSVSLKLDDYPFPTDGFSFLLLVVRIQWNNVCKNTL